MQVIIQSQIKVFYYTQCALPWTCRDWHVFSIYCFLIIVKVPGYNISHHTHTSYMMIIYALQLCIIIGKFVWNMNSRISLIPTTWLYKYYGQVAMSQLQPLPHTYVYTRIHSDSHTWTYTHANPNTHTGTLDHLYSNIFKFFKWSKHSL